MKKIVLTVATVVLLYAIAVGAAPTRGARYLNSTATQSEPGKQAGQPQVRTFVGTINKVGNQFVFSDDVSKNSYQLDDQETASKFNDKKVRVTGTLDSASNLIRVQSIEATA